jgi:hypothetical protein
LKTHFNIHPCLCLPRGFFLSGFSHQNPVCTSPLPICATCPTHLIFLGLINRIIGKKYTSSCSSSLFNDLYSLVTSSPLSTLFKYILPQCERPSFTPTLRKFSPCSSFSSYVHVHTYKSTITKGYQNTTLPHPSTAMDS